MREINGFDFSLSLRRMNSRVVSKLSGIPESVVSQIRCGKRTPSPAERSAILKVLDLPADLVFAGPEVVQAVIEKLDTALRAEIAARMVSGQRDELAQPLPRR